MTPLVFKGCKAWLHPATAGRATGLGVVICEAFGFEQLCAHRGIRHLAEALAQAGIATLRFDYPGTGDSIGNEAPCQVTRWIDSIDDAVDCLRAQTGLRDVALCGLRMGAALAVMAAARRQDVAALVLMAPVLSGRNHVRELRFAARMATTDTPATTESEWLEVAGFPLHQSDLAALQALDIPAALNTLCCPVLTLDPAATQDDTTGALTTRRFDGYAAMMRSTEDALAPREDIAGITQWLRQHAPPLLQAMCCPVTQHPAAIQLDGDIVEQGCSFGADGSLYGVLCRPSRPAGGTAVLILNTGGTHRIGTGRHAVLLARRLAQAGIASLRIDAHGIGDSVGQGDPELPSLYTLDAVPDVVAALDLLESQGYARGILLGICSGAHLALHAALRDNRAAGVIMVNLQFFEPRLTPHHAAPAGILRRLIDGSRALRFRLGLHRQAAPGLTALLRRLSGGGTASRRNAASPTEASGEPQRYLQSLRLRGVEVMMVYSDGDPGLVVAEQQFGKGGEILSRQGLGTLHILGSRNHSLASRSSQKELAQLLDPHLRSLLVRSEA